MRYCGTCGRREDRHSVRHPFKPWTQGQRPVVVPQDPATGLCEQELDAMGSE